MSEAARIVLVGHCVPDSFLLRGVIGKVIPGARVERCNDDAALEAMLRGGGVFLVNRVLDGEFADTRGIELIRRIRAGKGAPVSMLISNLDDAQTEAEQAGAVPGFGKAKAGSGEAATRLRSAVAMIGTN